MNYQEAIEILGRNKPTSDPRRCGKELCEACDVAISAMQELQELHDQGISLERLKDIDFRKEVVEHINYDAFMRLMDELEEYKQLGTLEEVREAVEKQKKKKPKGDLHSVPHYRCPNCNSTVKLYQNSKKDEICKWCGQRIDWSEVQE